MRVLHTFPGVLVPIDHRHSVLASLGPRLQRSSAKCSLRKTDQGIPRGCSSKCNFAGCKAQVGALSTAFIEVLQVMPKNGSMMVHLVASVPSPTYTISAGTPSHRHVAKVQAQPSLHLQVDALITTSSTSETTCAHGPGCFCTTKPSGSALRKMRFTELAHIIITTLVAPRPRKRQAVEPGNWAHARSGRHTAAARSHDEHRQARVRPTPGPLPLRGARSPVLEPAASDTASCRRRPAPSPIRVVTACHGHGRLSLRKVPPRREYWPQLCG